MDYTVQYFIDKFEAIPEDKWCDGWGEIDKAEPTCATGHCGFDNYHYFSATDENISLIELFKPITLHYLNRLEKVVDDDKRFSWKVVRINDGGVKEYQQPTPKQRILAALYDIRAMQSKQPAYENISKSLAVLPVSETSDVVGVQGVKVL